MGMTGAAGFTGKERDAETGLDYFGARYFSGAQGRFTSPDEPLIDQDPADPQSWNLYSYVRNNPLANIDLTGNDCITTSNQTDNSVTVTVTSGQCGKGGGAYVPGTVDMKSLTYSGTSVGYSYTPYDNGSSIGSGTVKLGQPAGDINPFGLAVVQSVGQRADAMYGMMGAFAGASVVGGGVVAGGLAASGAGLTSLGLRGIQAMVPLLPAVPSAIQKLQKIGLTLQEANEILRSPATQRLIDNANSGNVNFIKEVGGKLIRITTDPSGQRIISAGYVQARNVANSIASGRFTVK
jgi:RHS repeat-associated protein